MNWFATFKFLAFSLSLIDFFSSNTQFKPKTCWTWLSIWLIFLTEAIRVLYFFNSLFKLLFLSINFEVSFLRWKSSSNAMILICKKTLVFEWFDIFPELQVLLFQCFNFQTEFVSQSNFRPKSRYLRINCDTFVAKIWSTFCIHWILTGFLYQLYRFVWLPKCQSFVCETIYSQRRLWKCSQIQDFRFSFFSLLLMSEHFWAHVEVYRSIPAFLQPFLFWIVFNCFSRNSVILDITDKTK